MGLIGSGRLGHGGVDQYSVILKGNVTYRVYVQPDRSGVDFDLKIYDENENLIEWDEDPASSAMCLITPKWTGPFMVAVISYAGTSSYRIFIDP
jgi:hypothetical protein